MTGLSLGGEGGSAWSEQGNQYGVESRQRLRDITFRIGAVTADRLQPPMPDITIGEVTSFTLGIEQGGIGEYDNRYAKIRDYIEATSTGVEYGNAKDGTPWFAESQTGIPLAVSCEPGRDHKYSRGYWGFIVAGGDNTQLPGPGSTLTLDILILAPLGEFEDIRDVREEFER